MLKYNAVKRVKELTSYFLVYAVSSDCPLENTNIIEQNKDLKDIFTDYWDVGDILNLLFSLISSSIFFPIIYYAISLLNLFQFDQKIFIIASLIAFVLIGSYNYIEYNRLRKDLKTKFIEIRKEIRKLT